MARMVHAIIQSPSLNCVHTHLPFALEPQAGKGIKRRRARGVDDSSTISSSSTLSITEKKRQQAQVARANRLVLERVTELADWLLASGLSGIYDMSFEAIHASTVMWEYKGADGGVYGPYSSHEIAAWKARGYLTGPTAVHMRRVQAAALRIGPPGASASGHGGRVDSIYDDEDIKEVDGAASAAVVAVAVAAEGRGDEWQLSDDIDFGEYVDLDQEACQYETQAEIVRQAKHLGAAPSTVGLEEENSDGEDT